MNKCSGTLAIFALLCTSIAFAQIPTTLSYQGLLTDAAGVPVADGNYDVSFRFYLNSTDLEANAAVVRGPFQVTTFKGLFTTIIGNNQPSALVNGPLPVSIGQQQHYVGIKVGTQAELTPRVMLTAVPYAFVANTVKTVDATTITSGTLPDARLSDHLQDLADGSLTGSKVGTGINASNITTGTVNGALVGTGLNASNITTGTLSAATISLSGNGASKLASGTTAQRPGGAVEGQIRYNTTEKVMEYFNGTDWFFMSPKIAYLKDLKDPAVDGGNFNLGAWRSRVLNTVEGDNSFVNLLTNSVSNTQFILVPGTYHIEGSAPAYRVLRHKCKIRDITNSSDVLIGTSELTEDVSNTTGGRSFVIGVITVAATTTFELQHYSVGTTVANGFGQSTGDGLTMKEIYSMLKITKIR